MGMGRETGLRNSGEQIDASAQSMRLTALDASDDIGNINVDKAQGPYRVARTPMVTFCFDDGNDTDRTKALAVFAAQGEVACSAIITSVVGTGAVLTWSQIAELEDAGWEIISHSVTGQLLAAANEATIITEMGDSLATLRAQGLTVESFAYPGTSSSELSRGISPRYYRSARGRLVSLTQRNWSVLDTHLLTADSAAATAGDLATNEAAIKALIDDAYTAGQWLEIVFHQINDDDAAALDRIIQHTQDKSMPIVTRKQALDLRETVFQVGDIFGGAGFGVGPRGEMIVASLLALGVHWIEIGGEDNHVRINASGNLEFVGLARFKPRQLSRGTLPVAGTGAQEIDDAEAMIWENAGTRYLVHNRGGVVKHMLFDL